MLYRVYVDEAGDRGISPTSSKHFVVSAIIVADEQDALVRAEHARLVDALGRRPGHVLHFRKLTHPQKIKAAQDIGGSAIAAVTSVIIHKGLLGKPLSDPTRSVLLQLADAAASALFRAVEPDDYENTERRYLDHLSPKVYRRGGAMTTSYGLKVFPTSQCAPGMSLDWLRTF